VEAAATQIVQSPEYQARRGDGTTSGFLAALYRDALQRDPDALGLSAHSAALSQGATPAQVVEAVFASTEADSVLVQALYGRFLGRDAEAAGLATHVAALQHGTRLEDVLAAFLASDEFYANAAI
jgi:hypothetical protein